MNHLPFITLHNKAGSKETSSKSRASALYKECELYTMAQKLTKSFSISENSDRSCIPSSEKHTFSFKITQNTAHKHKISSHVHKENVFIPA